MSVCAALCIAVLGLAPSAALANSNRDLAQDAGIGTGSALASILYAPVKICYAAGGLVVGGLAWAFSGGDKEVASVILTPSLRGDYVVTPAHLQGKKRVEFFGRKAEYDVAYDEEPPAQQDVAAAPPAEALW